MKLDVLHRNPNVCFEVDQKTDMANWQSAIVRGVFDELAGEDAEKARHVLYNRVFPMKTSSTIHTHEHYVETEISDAERIKPVVTV